MKVQVFWEGHKILKKMSQLFWHYLVNLKKVERCFSNFVAFSEYLNFKKELDLSDLSPKKIQKVLMKIEEMADVFLNSANVASHAFLTLAPPSGYALNLKALIKVSKVSWTSQLSYEILRFSLERKCDMTNFISPKRTPQNNPG